MNFTPWLVTSLFRLGMAFSVPGNWSSVRTKTMLGLVWPCASIPFKVTPHASSTAKAIEASSTTVLFIPSTFQSGAREPRHRSPPLA